MLGRKHRFHGRGSLLPVYKQAQVVRGEGCNLHFRPNPRRREYRLAVVVSRKVSKSAVHRNRIRRRVYEIVRQSITTEQPVDLIITVFDENFATLPHNQLASIITKLLRKSHLISG